MRTATLCNTDRSEYGVNPVDLDLLEGQIAWLATMPACDEREGLLNLLGEIMDLADPPDAEEAWAQFGDIPINENGEILAPFRQFPAGTLREDVWHWFEEEFGVSVHDLLF